MISSTQIDQYNKEGYTIVENVFSQSELQPVLDEFEEIVDTFAERAFASGKIPDKHSDKDVFKINTKTGEVWIYHDYNGGQSWLKR